MASFVQPNKTDRTQPPTVHVVEHVQDVEQAPVFPAPKQPSSSIPRWPRILSASTHILIVLLSIVILGLGSHTLAGYSGTRGIHFGGVSTSWPTDLDLRPIYIFLAVSAMSVLFSIPSAILAFRWLKLAPFSLFEVASTMFSLMILLMWLAADFLQRRSESTPKKDLLSWACRRTDSPTNALIQYRLICQEQIAIKDIAIVVTIAHFGVVLSSAATWHFAEKLKNTAASWNMKH